MAPSLRNTRLHIRILKIVRLNPSLDHRVRGAVTVRSVPDPEREAAAARRDGRRLCDGPLQAAVRRQ